MVKLEAPGVEADRDVVGERVGAGEIKIDQAGQPIAEEEHVVGKQIGMDHALWQVARPMPLEMIELGNDRLLEPRLQAIGTARGSTKQRPPALDRDRKSTRLNSSHLVISYAVFCLKKKNTTDNGVARDPPTREHDLSI